MIRITFIVSLTLMLVLVLYLPASRPAETFIDRMRIEHQLHADFWGMERGERILERAFKMQDAWMASSPIPSSQDAPDQSRLDGAVANELDAVNHRFFNNSYFRAVDALLMLAVYRLSASYEWVHVLAWLMLAFVLDGLIVRIIKTREFRHHDPEMFAVYLCGMVILPCASVVLFATPIEVTPLGLAAVPTLVGFWLGRCITHYHRRGG